MRSPTRAASSKSSSESTPITPGTFASSPSTARKPVHPILLLLASLPTLLLGQRWLVTCLEQLFPGVSLQENHKHPDLVFLSNRHMELDVFLPSLNLAFEVLPSPFPRSSHLLEWQSCLLD